MNQLEIKQLANKHYRMQHLYKIKNKKHNLVTFKYNNAQQTIVQALQGQKPIRNITIKARQEGVSTFWLIYWLDETLFTENVTTGILSHKWESLNHLWSIVTLAFRYIPPDLKPPLGEESKRALYFKEIESKIFISLSIQSTGLHNLHISEWCWCKDQEVKITLGAVSPYTNISGESTGNGVANDGYNTYQDAKTGDNEYKYQFLPWYIQKEYSLPLNEIPGPQIMAALRPDEKKLKAIMLKDRGLDLKAGQVLWRRQAQKRLKDLFPQEFPETDEDAFITSGMHYFNMKKIMVLLNEARAYNKDNPAYEVDDRYIMFEQPDKRYTYAAGADTSEGVNDYCVLKIINVTLKREAFVFRARCGVKTFYKQCNLWCMKYNYCLLAVENNFPGNAVLLGLQEDCRYKNLYEKRESTRVLNKMGDKPKVKVGWQTSSASRNLMLTEFKCFIEDEDDIDEDNFAPEYTILDEGCLREALTFINNNGKYEAEPGKFDDTIIASAIATQMYKILRPYQARINAPAKGGINIGTSYESTQL